MPKNNLYDQLHDEIAQPIFLSKYVIIIAVFSRWNDDRAHLLCTKNWAFLGPITIDH